jgi:hypothetical protein
LNDQTQRFSPEHLKEASSLPSLPQAHFSDTSLIPRETPLIQSKDNGLQEATNTPPKETLAFPKKDNGHPMKVSKLPYDFGVIR